MTATTFSRPLMQAGSVAATYAGRAGVWTMNQYMRAPLASTGLLVMVTLTALAASNALYFQTQRHPAPMFAQAFDVPVSVAQISDAAPDPMPTVNRAALPAVPVAQETTGSVMSTAAVAQPVPEGPVGNPDAFAVQKKLFEMGMFNGKVDGFYGPQTASAIRMFEQRNGMNPTGAMSRNVIDAIMRADAAGRLPQAQIAPVVQQPVQQAVVVPQPAPAPIAQPQQPDQVVAVIPTLSPVDNAVDAVGNAAAQTLDSIVAAVDGGRSAPQMQASAPVPVMPLIAPQPVQPMPVQVASLEEMAPPQAALATTAVQPANNTQLVSSIQRGLSSLGFYRGSIDGHPGDGTAKAIREFENFHSYRVTGQINPDLVGLLRQAGAEI